MEIFTALLLIATAAVLFIAVRRGWIPKGILKTLADIAQVVALLAAIVTFVLPLTTPTMPLAQVTPTSSMSSSLTPRPTLTGTISARSDTATPKPSDTTVPSTPTPVPPTNTPTTVPSTSTPTPDPRLFWDDFETGIRPEWQMSGNNYSMVNGQLSSLGWFTAYIGDTTWGNYAVEFDLLYLIWSRYDFRILVRRQSDTDYMGWQLNTINGCTFRWVIVQRGQEKVIVNSETSIGGWEECRGHYRIEVSGNTYRTYKDGQMKLVFTNNELSSGNVGVVSTGKGETNFKLDNFVVRRLP